jgi:hypothetical protein
MALQLNTGLQGSIFAAGYDGASVPAAAGATPQGPRSIGQQAFGIVAGDQSGPNTSLYAAVGGGALALAALVFIWWSLPR